jgi:predicted AAA+ superfamily ATPase
LLGSELIGAFRRFPALVLTGPRRAGKTTLLRRLFPEASYHLLEDPDVIARIRADARSFIDEVRRPAILDEVQNVPEILNYVRSRIDGHPARKGQWLLTGSQEASLMRGVTESMAGRAATFQLLPFSIKETERVSLFRGGFPEILEHPARSQTWFRSYVQTYLERDVRAVSSIRDLATFRRFLSLLASRCGQMLNKTELAAPLGVSVPTISEWLGILEITGQILLVPPFFENFGKRLVKSPKLYFVDSGLACHLLGIESPAELNRSLFLGPVFEGFVAAEIVKVQIGGGWPRQLYYFRDQQGLEVDFIVPMGNGRLINLEAKASRTVAPGMATSLQRLATATTRYRVESFVVHRKTEAEPATSVLSPGVKALALGELLDILRIRGARRAL